MEPLDCGTIEPKKEKKWTVGPLGSESIDIPLRHDEHGWGALGMKFSLLLIAVWDWLSN